MTRQCTRCGATIPPEASACPRCLFALGMEKPAPAETSSSSSTHPRSPRGRAPTVEELAPLFPQLLLLELLGEGGMGVVYKARHRQLGRLVALKVLPREATADPAFVERFAREARALAQLDHPHIVRVHDHGEAGGYPYLTMEFVDGENLRQRLRAGNLGPREALALVPQICDALQYAHDEGVVHRDIKPENILVTRDGRVKVADFGLVRLTGDAPSAPMLTRAGETVGTPHYMAPEQLERPAEVDHRADIYALGVVFYELLTGTLPRGKFEVPSRRVQVDVRVDDIVLKSLEHEPERRYQHALEMKGDVQAASRTEPQAPAVTSEPPRLERTMSWPRGVLGWIATFTLLWFLCGLAFNAGAVWLALAGLLLAAGFENAVHSFAGTGPRLSSKHGRFGGIYVHFGRRRDEDPSVRRARLASFGAMLVGFALLGLGLVGMWEQSSPGYFAPLTKAAYVLSEAETRTLYVDVSRWEVLLREPWLIAPGVVLLFLSGAWAVAGSGRGRARAWPGAVRAIACCLVPLAVYHGAARLAESGPTVSAPFSLRSEVARQPSAVLAGLPGALADAGYATNLRAYLVPSEATLYFACADAASVLDRWHLTLAGPVREHPPVVFNAEPQGGNGGAWTFEAACGRSADAERQAAWEAWLRDLVTKVEG